MFHVSQTEIHSLVEKANVQILTQIHLFLTRGTFSRQNCSVNERDLKLILSFILNPIQKSQILYFERSSAHYSSVFKGS